MLFCKKNAFFFFLAVGMIPACFAFSEETVPLSISEIAWMGTSLSFSDEWIELYNPKSDPLSLEGWLLRFGEKEILLEGVIPPLSFFLLERTDDNAVPEKKADQIYSGSLGNKGEKMQIIDPFQNIVEEVDCSEGWFAGENSGKLTMERKDYSSPPSDAESWQSSSLPGGTPKEKNSIPEENFAEKSLAQRSPSFESFSPESPLPPLLPAFGTAIFSSVAMFILKKELKKEYNKSI